MARNCKYHKIETKVSYDDGQTWESKTPPVYHIGGLIEAHSQDCESGTTLERWITVEGDYLCDGNNKWTKQLLQNSYDGGVTWYASAPTTFRLGEFVEVDEEYCLYASEAHYIVPDIDWNNYCQYYITCGTGYRATYNLGLCYCKYVDPVKIVKCSTDTITENYLANGLYNLYSLKLGECARVVSIDPTSTFATQRMRPYLTNIDATNAANLEIISGSSFANCSGLTSITIPSSVTSIGEDAFFHCTSLTSVSINDAPVAIGNYAFGNCTSLENLNLGNSATSIGTSAFTNCSSLTSVTIPNSVTSIGNYAFQNCTNLANAYIGSGSIGQEVFSGCSSLTSVVLGGGVTSISDRGFYSCSAITSVTINDAPVAIGNSAFFHCTSLENLNLGNSATSIGTSAFIGCTSLTSVTIPNSVTSIGNSAFQGCSGLTSVNIPSGITSFGKGIFEYCYNITSVDIPSGVTSIGDRAFHACSGLTSLDIPSTVTTIGESAFGDCKNIPSVTIPSGVTYIGESAFGGCSGLTSITCLATTPPTLGTGGYSKTHVFDGTNNCPIYVPCDSYYAYRNDSLWSRYGGRLQPIQPCDIQYKVSVTYTGATSNIVLCNSSSALTSSEIREGGSRYAVTSVEIGNCASSISSDTFENCDHMTDIHISSSITSIGDHAFYGCSSLSGVSIDDIAAWCNIDFTTGANTNPISRTGKLYMNDQRVTALTIPSGVTSIGNYAFNGFTDLTSLTLPDSVTSIGNYGFRACSNLHSVEFPSGLTSIGTSAFYWCRGLTSVELPDSVTSIGESAFRDCSSATSIEIGSGITSIGASAFTNCSSLTAITISASTPPRLEGNMDRRTFENTNNCPIYVPCASVNAYKTTGGWSNYLSRIQGFGICPSKLIATYSDSTVDTIDCNGDSSLNWSETRNMSNPVSSMTIADIGNCATNINGAFNGATSLTSVTMPDSVVSLVNNAFRNCSGLTSIDLSSGLTTIGEGSFRNCKELTAITIPSGVTSIGDWAFYNCVRLTSMTVEATTPPTLGSNALEFTNNCPIYVPAASVSSYQSASGWSDYASRIRAIQ